MFLIPGFTPTQHLSWIVELFRQAMWAEPRTRGLGSLSFAVWTRVKGLERRFSRLYALWEAGKLPLRPSARSAVKNLDRGRRGETQSKEVGGAGGAGGAGADRAAFDPMACDVGSLERARLRPMSVLPRTVRWLQKVLPVSAATLAGGVESLLWNYPETQAFVAECPQAGRILRPLCTITGLTPPEWLRLPKRARKSRAPLLSEADEAELARLTARFPDTPPARSARRALRRMFAGLPVNFERLGAVARGYVVHPPRDGNCPPPEIGYGGRWRPLPKDYEPPPKDDE